MYIASSLSAVFSTIICLTLHVFLQIRISESFKHGECEYSSEKRTESYYTDPALQMVCVRNSK